MNKAFSVYLDLVRFGAACLVYLYHSNQRWLIKDILPMSDFGHASVIVFFVLSGFVIAYVTDMKERRWQDYAASRISRVFSVVIPALILCVVLDGIGRSLWAEPYSYPFDRFIARFVGSLLMLNEIWFVSITSFSNVPFWSITFEFWYYALFGLVMFLPRPAGAIAAAVLLLVLGPKIALLAPLWVAGVALYRWRALQHLPLALAWSMVVGSTAAIIGLYAAGVPDAITAAFKAWIGPANHEQMTFSKFFIADYLLGLLVFCNFAGMRRVAPVLAPFFERIATPVRWVAGYTFTLYLLHQPLFLFWGSVIRGDAASATTWWLVTGATAASILAIGHLTEQRRHHLKRTLELAFDRLTALSMPRRQGA
jgi:peptidoglycan/LPS O-acetylase OafA/YrhL